MKWIDKRIAPRPSKKIDRAPRVAKQYSNKIKSAVKMTQHIFVAQAKMMRVMQVIMLLHTSRFSIPELASELDQSQRTVYRYINLLEALDFGIEKDFDNRYFLVEDSCPLCGGKLHR